MFYQGGEIPQYVNYIGTSSVRIIAHTQEPMILVLGPSQELWRKFPEWLFKKSFVRDTKGRKR